MIEVVLDLYKTEINSLEELADKKGLSLEEYIVRVLTSHVYDDTEGEG